MEKIIDKIRETRNVKESTLAQYKTSITVLCEMLNDGKICDINNLDFLEDTKTVMNKFKDMKLTTKKNKIGMILVLLGLDKDKYSDTIQKYRDIARELRDTHDKFINTQTKTETQKKNWIEFKDYQKLVNKISRQLNKDGIRKKDILSKSEYQLLMTFVFLFTFQHYPFRNTFSSIKIIDKKDYEEIANDHKGNWLIIDNDKPVEFILHDYKTSGAYGMKTIKINKKVQNVMRVWLKHNKSDYLFTALNNPNSRMSSNNFTRWVQSIFKTNFNKTIGTTLLRHIIISHEHKDKPSIKEVEESEKKTEDKYLHSSEMNMKYAKKD